MSLAADSYPSWGPCAHASGPGQASFENPPPLPGCGGQVVCPHADASQPFSARSTLPGFPWHDPLDCLSFSLHQAGVPQAGEHGSFQMLQTCRSLSARPWHLGRPRRPQMDSQRVPRSCRGSIQSPDTQTPKERSGLSVAHPPPTPPALASHQTLDLDLSPQPGQGS